MEINRSGLILISLVVLVTGFIFGSFASSAKVTGYVASDQLTTLSISNTKLKIGEHAQITILPGAKGVYDILTYHTTNELGVLGPIEKRKDICNSLTCHETINFDFSVSADWQAGEYAAVVKDVATGTKIPVYFEIIE